MKIDKAKSRDKKRDKRINGMRISGRSLVHIYNSRAKRARKAAQDKERRENRRRKNHGTTN